MARPTHLTPPCPAYGRYGLDCILVKDAVATATVHGGKMVECLSAAVARAHTAEEIVTHLSEHPELIEKPKAPLVGSVHSCAGSDTPRASVPRVGVQRLARWLGRAHSSQPA